ncbi:MAG: hypothetical protein NTW28_12425 [Candidatus Solibacter sp.]|nr:hypothetical protein [Candidatus Solibacter sp.]
MIYRDQNGDNQVLGTSLLLLRGDRERRVLLSSGGRQVLSAAQLTDLANKIRGWQFEVEQTEDLSDLTKLQRAGVVILGNQWGGFTSQELDAILQFVKDGGGLLAVGLGWSWEQARPGAPKRPMDQYPMNQLVGHFGAAFTEKPIFQ